MISPQLTQVICSEVGHPGLELHDEMLANQVPGWDSLEHVRILAAVEKAFGVRFRGLEVLRLKNLGELQQLVDAKVKAKAA